MNHWIIFLAASMWWVPRRELREVLQERKQTG